MLVGREGKVANSHVHGVGLSKRIEELLSVPSSHQAHQASVLK